MTGSGGMLIGTVEEVGPDWSLDLSVGQKIATLVSLSLTPLEIYDGLEQWDGLSEQIPTDGHAVLFERTIAAALPDDFPENVALSAFDVCGAPALTRDIVTRFRDEKERPPTVAVIGGAGKSGSLALAAARKAGSSQTLAVVYDHKERKAAESATLADHVIVADATDPIAVSQAVAEHGGADITVVCVDVPGSEHGAILSTNAGGTIIFFSMATSFSGAALGAEGLAADVEMIIGNGYRPGHADYTLSLLRDDTSLRRYFFQLAQGEQS
nr:L-erythro-3,5-diaminohexanoate dehydrogenase [Haloglycomyces albus]